MLEPAMDAKPQKQNNHQQQQEEILSALDSIKTASKDLQYFTSFITKSPQPTIKAILELGNKTDSVLGLDPDLFKLSELLGNLKTLLDELDKSQGYGLKMMIIRQVKYYKISQIAWEIDVQVQWYLDKGIILSLIRTLDQSDDEDEKLKVLTAFENRVLQGFNGRLQDLILKSKVFSVLESVLSDTNCSKSVREESGLAIVALVHFNRNVFVGLVLMGPTVESLISIGSSKSITSLCSLVKLIRSPLIDDIDSHGEIPRIVGLLNSEDSSTRASCLQCICEIAYHGRKEVIAAIVELGLVEKLVGLQRLSENGGYPEFASCVAKFAVQIEVGEGLTQQEKGEMKMEILRRVKEASVSEAEAASISAEVLWGSSPLSF